MFTGIIETIGEVVSAQRVDGDLRLIVKAAGLASQQINIGDSVACNGVCLTVVVIKQQNSVPHFTFDVSIESLDHSLIGEWQAGSQINIELAMLPSTRLGGHLVSGHVDGVARLTTINEDARSWRMVFEVPSKLQKYIAKKGSVTINGTSLTVNSVKNNVFDINVIPHTLEVTTLGNLQSGEQVHIEVDLIARYLERLLLGDSEASDDGMANTRITESFLAGHGFT